MRKRIYALVLAVVVVALLAIGFWAYKSGKFAGLADVIKSTPVQSPSMGVLVDVKEGSALVAGATVYACPASANPFDPFCSNGLGGTTGSNGQYYVGATSPICTQPGTNKWIFNVKKDSLIGEKQNQEVTGSTYCSTLTSLHFTIGAANPPAGSASLSGTVKNGTALVEGAIVSVRNSGGTVLGRGAVTSDKDGKYSIVGITPGIDYKVLAVKVGIGSKEFTGENFASGQARVIDFQLGTVTPPPAPSPDTAKFIYMIEIVDSAGARIGNVQTEINSYWKGTSKIDPIDPTKYENSNLVIWDVRWNGPNCPTNDTYTVTFKKSAYQDLTKTFTCNEITLNQSLNGYVYDAKKVTLGAATTSLSGTVTDIDTKKPIKDAAISLIFNGATLPGSGTKTDGQGKYKIDNLEPGTYSVFVYHPFYNDSLNLKEVEIKKGEISQKDFELKIISIIKRYDLFVQLLDENGKPFEIGQSIKKSEVRVMIRDVLAWDLYANAYPELVSRNDKQYFRFNYVPCGRQENVFARINHLFEIAGDKYSTVEAVENVNYSCSQDGEEKFLDLRLKKSSKDDPIPDDPKKPNISGDVYLYKDCFKEPIAYDYLKENIKVVIQKEIGKDYKSADLNPWGNYEIKDVEPGVYAIFVVGKNFKQITSFVQVKDQDATHDIAVNLNDPASYIKKITLNGIDLYFVGPIAQGYQDKYDWNGYTKRLASLSQLIKSEFTPEPATVPIYIADVDFFNIFSSYTFSDCSILGIQGPFIEIDSIFLPNSADLWGNLMHEYAHSVYDVIPRDDIFKKDWNILFDTAKKSADMDCVFMAIKDSNVSQFFDISGHPDDKDSEFFTSFFVAYFNHHDRLLQLIRSMPEGSDCRNILEYAWQLFAEKIAQTPGEKISSVQTQWPRLYSNDNALFIPVGGKIGVIYYTSYQIEKGLWKQNTYDQLKTGQKISIQITRTISQIYHWLKIDPARFKTNINLAIARFNQFIDNLYPGGNRGGVEGTVNELISGTTQNQPKANAIVIIGKKMGITDNNGKFKLEGIRIGDQPIKVIDGTNMKELTPDIETVNIKKETTVTILLNIQ